MASEPGQGAPALLTLAFVVVASPSFGADVLGDARLFFTAVERAAITGSGPFEGGGDDDERVGTGLTGTGPAEAGRTEAGRKGTKRTEGERVEGDETDDERTRGERNATASAGADPSSGDMSANGSGSLDPTDASARARRRPARRVELEALLRTGKRVRVIVGGEHCRGTIDVPDLQCGRLPDGVRAFALDGRRLVVTFRDGRRQRLAVGETLRP